MKIQNCVVKIYKYMGLAILVGGLLYFGHYMILRKTYVTANATFTEIKEYEDSDGDTAKEAYISYTDKTGKQYNGKLKNYFISFKKGGHTKIYYNPDNPSEFESEYDVKFTSIGCIIVGIVFYIVSKTPQIELAFKNKIKESGTEILATFDRVERYIDDDNSFYKAYRIYAKGPNGEEYHSEDFVDDPSDIIARKNIKEFSVYIDPDKKGKYYFPAEELKEVE